MPKHERQVFCHRKGGCYHVIGLARLRTGRPLTDMAAVRIWKDAAGALTAGPLDMDGDSRHMPLARAHLQSGKPLTDGALLVVYQDTVAPHAHWARAHDEFHDGRFERLPREPLDGTDGKSHGQ